MRFNPSFTVSALRRSRTSHKMCAATTTNRIYDEKRLYAKIFGERIRKKYMKKFIHQHKIIINFNSSCFHIKYNLISIQFNSFVAIAIAIVFTILCLTRAHIGYFFLRVGQKT